MMPSFVEKMREAQPFLMRGTRSLLACDVASAAPNTGSTGGYDDQAGPLSTAIKILPCVTELKVLDL